jgi:hypothetical protein
MANLYSQFTYDDALALKDAGLITSTTAESATTILDLGPGLFDGYLVIDMTACEIATGDEKYTLRLCGSASSTMASGVHVLATKEFGNLTAPMDQACATAGRYVIPVRNEEGGTLFQYVSLQYTVAGSIATGMNFTAFLAKD